jgi:inner membrane protein YidH
MDEPDYRFTLANERTFLAWNRTALALVAGGLALTHLLPDGDPSPAQRAAGLALVVLCAGLVVASYRRWQDNDRAIRSEEPLPATRLPLLTAVTIAVTALAAVALSVVAGAG